MKPFFRRPPPRVTVAQLLAWAEAQVARGVPRQTICHGWLRQDRQCLTPEEKSAYDQAERQLFGEMVARNVRGAELEKLGRSAEARELYEANVTDGFVGAHPYQRLQALYLACGDYDRALRVSRLHTQVLASSRAPVRPSWGDDDEFDVDANAAPRAARLRLVDL